MGISPCGIHYKWLIVLSNGFGKSLWTLLEKNLSPSIWWWGRDIDWWWNWSLRFYTSSILYAFDIWVQTSISIYRHFSKELKQSLHSSICVLIEMHELWV